MSKNTDYVSMMEARMKKWDEEVEALSVEAGKKARAAYYERVKELCASRDAAQKSFRTIQAASESASAQMHAGMEAAWDTMQETLKKAASDLRG
ncbi:MAG: hypothetical protein H7Y14_08925 [Burkholderiales bacterium]|nr:hypothetical protein [Burkholderiales bacterium]